MAPDEYDKLVKALAGYNGDQTRNLRCSLPDMIASVTKTWQQTKNNQTQTITRNCGNPANTQDTIKGYAEQILHGKTDKNSKLNLPYRVYIWKGGVEPATIPVVGTDGNVEQNPDGTTKMETNPNAGQDWCFAYGESEWMSGKDYTAVKDAARGDLLATPQVLPEGRVNCSDGAAI